MQSVIDIGQLNHQNMRTKFVDMRYQFLYSVKDMVRRFEDGIGKGCGSWNGGNAGSGTSGTRLDGNGVDEDEFCNGDRNMIEGPTDQCGQMSGLSRNVVDDLDNEIDGAHCQPEPTIDVNALLTQITTLNNRLSSAIDQINHIKSIVESHSITIHNLQARLGFYEKDQREDSHSSSNETTTVATETTMSTTATSENIEISNVKRNTGFSRSNSMWLRTLPPVGLQLAVSEVMSGGVGHGIFSWKSK
ncbi:hypothetical protein HDU76_003997 [Blyttiomyces sp. JEL0837]|nr:hypothetical protein HDU76_003997 [Blyttiomyces sp. JEL0837]